MWKLVVFHTGLEANLSMWDNTFLQNKLNIWSLDSIALQSYALLQRSNKVLTLFSVVKNLNCWIMFWLGKRPFQSEWRNVRTSVFCEEAISYMSVRKAREWLISPKLWWWWPFSCLKRLSSILLFLCVLLCSLTYQFLRDWLPRNWAIINNIYKCILFSARNTIFQKDGN